MLNEEVQIRDCDAIVLDIEGTTCPAAYVLDTLFPYSRERLTTWVHEHADEPETAEILSDVARACSLSPTDYPAITSQLAAWIDQDVKAAPLKALQGLIWEAGFATGELITPHFPDVAPRLKQWKDAGLTLAVYSSGSIRAQHCLFRYTTDGDLDELMDANFDIGSAGPKKNADSFELIARTLDLPAHRLLFLTDIQDELNAAHTAGWQVCGLRRPGELQATATPYVASFDELELVL